jgi:spore maturation protein B
MDFMGMLQTVSDWAVPAIVLFIPLYAMFKGVKVYEVFVDGAKEGFSIGVTIMPYLVAILVAIGLMRDVRLLDVITQAIEPLTMLVYLPGEILPLALIRPLSGGGPPGS